MSKKQKKPKKAKFKCIKCAIEWEQKPGSVSCIACGCKYVKWVNYEKDFEGK